MNRFEVGVRVSRRNRKTMTSAGDILENMSIDKWLAELHMECYKKNLEKYNTIKVSELVYLRIYMFHDKVRKIVQGCSRNVDLILQHRRCVKEGAIACS